MEALGDAMPPTKDEAIKRIEFLLTIEQYDALTDIGHRLNELSLSGNVKYSALLRRLLEDGCSANGFNFPDTGFEHGGAR